MQSTQGWTTLRNAFLLAGTLVLASFAAASAQTVLVDTGQQSCYDDRATTSCPQPGNAFYGQDSQYDGVQPAYRDNGDGTVTDLRTGLVWERAFRYLDWSSAPSDAAAATTGGYTDWRVPTILELYSLIDFSGSQGTGDPSSPVPPADAAPFLDTDAFDFEYPSVGRYIDAQYLTSTAYTSTVFEGQAAFFGVNFADGRIKGYPQFGRDYYARYVRRSQAYGVHHFRDNGDGTVTDRATGRMWLEDDSGAEVFDGDVAGSRYGDGSLSWEEALAFCEDLSFAGHLDWRLPDAKELQNLVDYGRSPDATGSPAIDPIFGTTMIVNEMGVADYPFFWSSTSFNPGSDAVYVAFGEALGYMNGRFMDVHGAGAQRTDPKTGEPSYGFGPQGDVRRVYNYARCTRDADADAEPGTIAFATSSVPVSEGGGAVSIEVRRAGGSDGEVAVSYQLLDGSARAGEDFLPAAGLLTWADGQTGIRSFEITLIDDALAEGSESATVALADPTNGATLASPSQATLTIEDDDTPTGPCVPDVTTACLVGGRFRVVVDWATGSGVGGLGAKAGLGLDEGEVFSFFGSDNPELLVKVKDACVEPFQHFWVFVAATTNVEVRVTVTDTESGHVWRYHNPLGQVAEPVQDLEAFASCG